MIGESSSFFSSSAVEEAKNELGISHINLSVNPDVPLNQALVALHHLQRGLREAESTGRQRLVLKSGRFDEEGHSQIWILPSRRGEIGRFMGVISDIRRMIDKPKKYPLIESYPGNLFRRYGV